MGPRCAPRVDRVAYHNLFQGLRLTRGTARRRRISTSCSLRWRYASARHSGGVAVLRQRAPRLAQPDSEDRRHQRAGVRARRRVVSRRRAGNRRTVSRAWIRLSCKGCADRQATDRTVHVRSGQRRRAGLCAPAQRPEARVRQRQTGGPPSPVSERQLRADLHVPRLQNVQRLQPRGPVRRVDRRRRLARVRRGANRRIRVERVEDVGHHL